MNKVKIIILREYLSRVRKRSFLIMTLLGPIFIAAIFIIPVYLAKVSQEAKTIGVVDETGFFYEILSNSNSHDLKFDILWDDVYTARENMEKNSHHGILYIPQGAISAPSTIRIFARKQLSANINSRIESILQKEIESHKLAVSGIDKRVLSEIQTPIKINTIIFNDAGDEKHSFAEISTVLGLLAGFLIYIFIFSYGSQVMRGVIEEKTSRIVEIIVSSVKPFQLMLGKIVGIGMVGLTQFFLWIVFSFFIITAFQVSKPEIFKLKESQPKILENKGLTQDDINKVVEQDTITFDQGNAILLGIRAINFPVVIGFFIFYFLGGYLLYASLFAAIGSAVDNESDTQQFMLPVTVPLLISIILAQVVISDPDGSLSFWLSIIPLTSPIIMMVRIPFNPPIFDVVLSMSLLILGFLATTWFAAKIYRTGILMYGKKNSYKELFKWLRHS